MFSGHGGPRHEFANAVGGITVREPGERFGQPGVRVDAGELAVLCRAADYVAWAENSPDICGFRVNRLGIVS